MGLLKSFRKLLKTDENESAATSFSGTVSSISVPGEGALVTPGALPASQNAAQSLGRIASFTSTLRHETTIVERQGSTIILKEVKHLEPKKHGAEEDAHDTSHVAPTGKEADNLGYRRVLHRVASMPSMLAMHVQRDCDAAEASAHHLLDSELAKDLAEVQQSLQPCSKRRGPPTRRESLKCLLHLDQYKFNQDASTLEAKEALGYDTFDEERLSSALAAGTSGSLQDILTADGRTTVLLAASPKLPLRMRRLSWSLQDYVLMQQLHKGYASDVFQARCKLSGELVALKVYKLKEQGDIQRMQLYREIRLHSRVEHTNIIQFYACFLDCNRVVMVQEFALGGNLLKFMYRPGGRLSERQAVNLVLQPFLAAIHYLHTEGIVHRDIKPENVFLTDTKVLKLADFGLAIDLREERANTRAGTLDYMAPEVLRCPTKTTPDENKDNPQSAHYQEAVDAWAIGVFAYELVVGVPPFKASQIIDTARNIIHAPVQFPEPLSDMAKDFIMRALHKHAGDRPTALEMLHHPWITMYQRRSSVSIMHPRSIMETVTGSNGCTGMGMPHPPPTEYTEDLQASRPAGAQQLSQQRSQNTAGCGSGSVTQQQRQHSGHHHHHLAVLLHTSGEHSLQSVHQQGSKMSRLGNR